jgi:hypothetical protein
MGRIQHAAIVADSGRGIAHEQVDPADEDPAEEREVVVTRL